MDLENLINFYPTLGDIRQDYQAPERERLQSRPIPTTSTIEIYLHLISRCRAKTILNNIYAYFLIRYNTVSISMGVGKKIEKIS